MNLQQTRVENVQLQARISHLEMLQTISRTKAKSEESSKEYFSYLEELEKLLGATLKNKIIDDTTLEVRDVPEEPQLKGE